MPDPRSILGARSVLLAPLRRVAGAWRGVRRSAELVPEALEAVLLLPRVASQLEVISLQTATMPEMHAEVARMRSNTAHLPQIDETLERVATLLSRVEDNTAAVEQLAEVMLPLEGAALRVGRMADRWPARRRHVQTAPARDA